MTPCSPPNHTKCQQAPSSCSQPLPTDHSPTKMPRQRPLTRTSTPQPARDRKNRKARTRNPHMTPGDAQTPVRHSTHPRPPRHQQCRPHTISPRFPPRRGHRRTTRRPSPTTATPSPRRHTPPRLPPPAAAKRNPITRPGTQQRPPPHPAHINPPITLHTTSRRTGRALRPIQPRSGTAAPPGARRPGGASPPNLWHHPAHSGGHPGPGGHPGRGRLRLPLRRLPPRRKARLPPVRQP